MTSLQVHPGSGLQGELRVPGDKSISHRSVMLAALAKGRTRIEGFLQGEDSLHTLAAFNAMGVESRWEDAGSLTIDGVGLHGLKASRDAIYLGNSGTAMRLMAGLLSGQRFGSTLQGDESLSGRPMRRIADPLAAMGATILLQDDGTPPIVIRPVESLQPIDYALPVASAQVKSAVLLAALYADGETCVREPAPTRDHTERMLRAFGVPVASSHGVIKLQGGTELLARDVQIPADISSAAFFLVAASITSHSDLLLRDVGMNPTRDGVIEILRRMGADITVSNERRWGDEPVADLRVRSAKLRGIDIPESLVPLAIDEFPVLFVAAACAQGSTRLRGAAELRVKESDRIGAMADALQALGVAAEPREDGMDIEGSAISGGSVLSRGDHRIAMAMAIAALAAEDTVTVQDCDNIATSFPDFAALLRSIGVDLVECD